MKRPIVLKRRKKAPRQALDRPRQLAECSGCGWTGSVSPYTRQCPVCGADEDARVVSRRRNPAGMPARRNSFHEVCAGCGADYLRGEAHARGCPISASGRCVECGAAGEGHYRGCSRLSHEPWYQDYRAADEPPRLAPPPHRVAQYRGSGDPWQPSSWRNPMPRRRRGW